MNATPDQLGALDIARQLAEAGVPIFLAEPARKVGQWDPDGGHGGCGYTLPNGWQNVAADPKVLDRWRPGVAVCAVMGHGLDLVDVDPRNGGDPDTVKPHLPAVHAVASTPSGGWHAYVRTLGIRSRDDVLPGVDIKAGDADGKGRGFAFIAPTVRKPKTGGEPVAYRWERPPDLDGLRADEGTQSVRLVELVATARDRTRQPTQNGSGLTSPAGFAPSPLSDLDATIAGNGRHAAVVKIASALRGRGGWRVDDALTYMRDVVYPRLDQARGGHPYTLDELEQDVRDVFTRYPDGSAQIRPLRPAVATGPLPPDDPVDRAAIVRGGTFILDQTDDVPALWGRDEDVLAPSGEPTYIVGPEGVGKTTIGMQLVRARIGLADRVLGFPVQPDDRPVLYLAMDRPAQIARAFRRLFTDTERATLDDRLIVWRGPLPTIIENNPDQVYELAHQVGAGTVFIDSVKDLTPTIEKPESAGLVNRAFQRCVSQGVEVIALHHPRKANGLNKKPNSLDDLYGGRWLAAGAGSVLSVWGKAGDPVVELSHLKQPVNDVGPITVVHDHRAGTSSVEQGHGLLDVLAGSTGGLTAADAARLLYGTDKPRKADVEKIRRRLDDLHDQGVLTFEEADNGGRGGRPTKRFRVASSGVGEQPRTKHAAGSEPVNPDTAGSSQNRPQTQTQSNHATLPLEQPRKRPTLEVGRELAGGANATPDPEPDDTDEPWFRSRARREGLA